MKLFLLILVSISLLSCESDAPFPNDVDLKKVHQGFIFPFEIKVYEFDNLDLDVLINEKISCFSEKTPINWSRINQLESNIKYYLIRDMKSLAEDSDSFEEFISFNDKLSSSKDIFFTGCYSMLKDVKGKNIPSYNYMYFVDVADQKFYSIIFQR